MKRELGYKLPLQWLGPRSYRVYENMPYYSPRFRKTTTIIAPYQTDGATGAVDIVSRSWPHHDWFCDGHPWDDGTFPTRWDMSLVLFDQLREEGRWVRARTWCLATWLKNPFQGVTNPLPTKNCTTTTSGKYH